jgi:hypothetical protein
MSEYLSIVLILIMAAVFSTPTWPESSETNLVMSALE